MKKITNCTACGSHCLEDSQVPGKLLPLEILQYPLTDWLDIWKVQDDPPRYGVTAERGRLFLSKSGELIRRRRTAKFKEKTRFTFEEAYKRGLAYVRKDARFREKLRAQRLQVSETSK